MANVEVEYIGRILKSKLLPEDLQYKLESLKYDLPLNECIFLLSAIITMYKCSSILPIPRVRTLFLIACEANASKYSNAQFLLLLSFVCSLLCPTVVLKGQGVSSADQM